MDPSAIALGNEGRRCLKHSLHRPPTPCPHHVRSLTSPNSSLPFIAPDLQSDTCTGLLGKEPAHGALSPAWDQELS